MRLAFNATAYLVQCWLVMLILGAIHHSVTSDVRAYGFHGVMLFVALVRLCQVEIENKPTAIHPQSCCNGREFRR